MSDPATIRAVAFGVDVIAMQLIRTALPRVHFRELPLDISEMLKPQLDFEPDMIFSGAFNKKTPMVDVAQGIRSMYSSAPVYFVTSERRGFDRKGLIKNGFSDAFLMPMDQTIIRDLVAEGAAEFKNVALVDLSPETVLTFDTYLLLPVNRKYIKFSAAGYALDAHRVKRLLDRRVSSVHVAQQDLRKFYDFTAQQLKRLTIEGTVSQTERRTRLHAAVRSLLTGFLTDGAELQDCAQIIHSYILGGTDSTEQEKISLYERILRLGGAGGDGYLHVANVSTLAALLAMVISPANVENVALAGLLHDIGIAEIPIKVQTMDAAHRTAEHQADYQRHPDHSVELLRTRKIQAPTEVLDFIAQHHERYDGKGYPKGLVGDQVRLEAQLLMLADEYDYQTTVSMGAPRLPADQVLRELLASPAFNPTLVAEITKLFELDRPLPAPI